MSHMDLTRVGCGSNTIQNIREASSAIAAKDEGVASGLGSSPSLILALETRSPATNKPRSGRDTFLPVSSRV